MWHFSLIFANLYQYILMLTRIILKKYFIQFLKFPSNFPKFFTITKRLQIHSKFMISTQKSLKITVEFLSNCKKKKKIS